MRTTPHARERVLLALSTALLLGACTSGEAPTRTTGTSEDSTATSAADGLTGVASENGWFCRYISPDDLTTALGGEAVTPREHQVRDDDKAWVCEVLTGGKGKQKPALRLSVVAGDQPSLDDLHTKLEKAGATEDGPAHLGRAWTADTMVAGFLPCTAPGATRRDQRAEYAVAVESLAGRSGAEVDDAMRRVATRIVTNLDQTVGCSPKLAHDDAATTSAP